MNQTPTENKQSDPIAVEHTETVGDWSVDRDNVGLPRRLSRVFSLIRYHRPAQFLLRAAKLARRELLNWNGGGAYSDWPAKLFGSPPLRSKVWYANQVLLLYATAAIP